MDALHFAEQLIRFDSVSSRSNAAVSDYVQQQLERQGFETERLEYDDAQAVRKVSIVAKKGSGRAGLAYFGHTDVVPAESWTLRDSGPFTPTRRDGRPPGPQCARRLAGRQACRNLLSKR